jgi:hypothetical protein
MMLHEGKEEKTKKKEREKDSQGGDAAAASPPLPLPNSCVLAAFHPTSQSRSALAAGSSFAGLVFSRKESSPPALSIVRRAVVVTGRRTCFPAAESQRDFCWTLGFQVRRELFFEFGVEVWRGK